MSTEQMIERKNELSKGSAKPQNFIRPQYNVVSEDDRHVVRVVAPGATKESVSIIREKDSLLITAHRSSHIQEGWKAIGREILDADYRLRLQLNAVIDDNGISAKLENGILEVVLPVAEEAKPRQIAID